MIRLEIVNERTFKDIIHMELPDEQKRFVASNVISLAQAWLYYDEARPYAVCEDDTPVGFVMLDWDEQERTVGIWRFMIAHKYQQKGYGRKALEKIIEIIRAEGKFDLIHLDYVPSNIVARNLYYSLGFRENGEIEDNEIIMTMPITDQPKVGMLTADEEDLEQLFAFLEKDSEDDPDVLSTFPAKDILEGEIEKENVTRFTIYGETIGVALKDNFYFRKKFLSYEDEARQKYASKMNE